MQLQDIIESGPVVFCAPVFDNKLGEVYNVIAGNIHRYVYDVELCAYRKAGKKPAFVEYDSTNLETLVEQAEEWWQVIISNMDGD